MIDLLLSVGARPFAVALFLFGGLLSLEVVSLLFGGSLLALDFDGVDVDLDLDADIDGSWLSWLGLGQVPFLLWFASLLVGFAIAGLAIQSGALLVMNGMLHSWLAAGIALVPGLLFAREVGTLILRYMPQSESSAVSRRRLGGRTGVITQGTAQHDKPAEARVRDAHGNIQYLRVVPAPDAAPIPQGTEIYVQSNRDGTFTARALTE